MWTCIAIAIKNRKHNSIGLKTSGCIYGYPLLYSDRFCINDFFQGDKKLWSGFTIKTAGFSLITISKSPKDTQVREEIKIGTIGNT